jgi:hypothetical protein
MAGRPLGSKNKDKPWAEALRVTLFREDAEGNRRLLAIAEKCAAAAEGGDMQAIKEIGDRLDGRATQESVVDVQHRYVARIPEKGTTPEQWQQQHSPDETTTLQ